MTFTRSFTDFLLCMLIAGLMFGWVDRDPEWMGWFWVALAIGALLLGISASIRQHGVMSVLRSAGFIAVGFVVAYIALRVVLGPILEDANASLEDIRQLLGVGDKL